jgi:hypothetical protein
MSHYYVQKAQLAWKDVLPGRVRGLSDGQREKRAAQSALRVKLRALTPTERFMLAAEIHERYSNTMSDKIIAFVDGGGGLSAETCRTISEMIDALDRSPLAIEAFRAQLTKQKMPSYIRNIISRNKDN